jgi:hypothetical protein
MLQWRTGTSRSMVIVVTIASLTLIPSATHAQWTVVNLHPAGAGQSIANGVGMNQQVGHADQHARLWSGSAESAIDLQPPGASLSHAASADGAQQVGDVLFTTWSAALWTGSAASWVNLNPAGSDYSIASHVRGGQQVGVAAVDGALHASLWTGSAESWVDLHPVRAIQSAAYGVDGTHQVGSVSLETDVPLASLWLGSAASWVTLHPAAAGATSSIAFGVHNDAQVGRVTVKGVDRASLWLGTAESWIDLHPEGALFSNATAISGGRQVGYAFIGSAQHAGTWQGSAGSWVDLHPFLPAGFADSRAQDVFSNVSSTFVVGYGFNTITGRNEALLWKLEVKPPPPPPCPPDNNQDGEVNGADLGLLLSLWGPVGVLPAADINGDGFIDGADLGLLLSAWGECPERPVEPTGSPS